MQIVIDIPEETYKATCNGCMLPPDVENVVQGIKNGTPLPKGHGRLIDADKIISEATERMKYPANHKYMECVIAHMVLAPTIIEADKEDKNE